MPVTMIAQGVAHSFFPFPNISGVFKKKKAIMKIDPAVFLENTK